MADYISEFNAFSNDAGYQDIANRWTQANDQASRDAIQREADIYNERKRNEWNASNPDRQISSFSTKFSSGSPTGSIRENPTPSQQSGKGVTIGPKGSISIGASKSEGSSKDFDRAKAEAAAATAKKAADQRKAETAERIKQQVINRLSGKGPTSVAGSLSGQRNYNEPARPANQSPQGPSSPIKYDQHMRMFVPAGPTQKGGFYLG